MTRHEQLTMALSRLLAAGPLGFGELCDRVQAELPWASVCEIDAAARPYETGEPGAYVYRLPEATRGQLTLPI